MHMGTDYRYASWQPITTNKTTKGTKAPYYGNIAVAAAIARNSSAIAARVASIPLPLETEAAYAVFLQGQLARIVLVNLQQYNYSSETSSSYVPPVRSSRQYTIALPASCANASSLPVRRLLANGSDAITGITFDGVSYNYELDEGKPVVLGNVTRGETAPVVQGSVSVSVENSSAAIVGVTC